MLNQKKILLRRNFKSDIKKLKVTFLKSTLYKYCMSEIKNDHQEIAESTGRTANKRTIMIMTSRVEGF